MKKRYLLIFSIIIMSAQLFAQTDPFWNVIDNDIKITKQYKRFEDFYRPRLTGTDSLPYDHFMTLKDEVVESELQSRSQGSRDGIIWEKKGPHGINSTWPSQWGVVSGRVRAIAVHPTDPEIVYVGAACGGIWKSTNGGQDWLDIGAGMEALSFGSIAIDPVNPENVYAGTGETMYNFNSVTFDGRGMFKSTDGGDTWTHITSGFGDRTHFGNIAVNPFDNSEVFATLGSGYRFFTNPGNEGVWKSNDYGITWRQVLNLNDGFDVLPDPYISDRIYAVADKDFHISTDGGDTWTISNDGISNQGGIGRMQIATAGDTQVLYLLVYYTDHNIQLYKSNDDGENWSSVTDLIYSSQGWYDLLIGVNPESSREVYIGHNELLRTTDGTNFDYVGGGYWDQAMHVDFHIMRFSRSNPDYRYVGCDGGIYKSTDGGANWIDINAGLRTIQFYRIASDRNDENVIIGGAQDNGNFRTDDGGASVYYLVTTGDGMECFIDPRVSRNVYMATQNGAIKRSTTGGGYGSFSSITPDWGSQPKAWTAPFFMHPTQSAVIYTASDRPWKSTDRGNTWEALSGSQSSSAIHTMDICSTNDNVMILSANRYSDDPDIKVSQDGGINWRAVDQNLPGVKRGVSRVVCSPVNEDLYVVRTGFGSGKLYYSSDFGTSWEDISGNLPDIPHNDLFIDPLNTDVLYIANDFGVYRTIDHGENWSRAGTGMPVVPAMDFSYLYINGKRLLRIGTHGRSIFETDLNNAVIPVELVYFRGAVNNGSVILEWKTATENNNLGFEIYRSSDQEEFERITFVDGSPSSSEPRNYTFTDLNPGGGDIIRYRLIQVDLDGTKKIVSEITVESALPEQFSLLPNYPNPFNPETFIRFAIPCNCDISLEVFDINGRKISALMEGKYEPGEYSVIFDARGLASGTYIYTLSVPSEGFEKSRKMILLK